VFRADLTDAERALHGAGCRGIARANWMASVQFVRAVVAIIGLQVRAKRKHDFTTPDIAPF
jgi:hypothetical protein